MPTAGFFDSIATTAEDSKFPSLWDDCVSAWCPCLGNQGSTLYDRSGFNRHGTLTNFPSTAWVTKGSGGYALDFDGSNDHADCGSCSMPSDILTVTAWVRPEGTGNFRGILNNGSSDGTSNFQFYLTGALLRTRWNGSTTATLTNPPLSNDVWQHVAFVRRGGTGAWEVTFYVDGYERNTTTSISTDPDTGTFPTAIGESFFATKYWNGMIDDVRVYGRELSLSEINTLAGFGGNEGVGRGIAYQSRRFQGIGLASAVAAGRIDRTIASVIPQELPSEYVW